MKRECVLTRDLCTALECCGAYIKPHVASVFNQPGWPDRWVCHRLWHGHLEFKRDKEQLSPLQRKRIAEINKRQPATAFVVRFVDNKTLAVESETGWVYCTLSCSEPLALLHVLKEIQDRVKCKPVQAATGSVPCEDHSESDS